MRGPRSFDPRVTVLADMVARLAETKEAETRAQRALWWPDFNRWGRSASRLCAPWAPGSRR